MLDLRFVCVGLLGLFLSACGSPYRIGAPAPVESHGETVNTGPLPAEAEGTAEVRAYRPPQQVATVRPAPSSRAVRNLMRRAAAQRRAGDYAAAQASLERALRIEPRNARLWNRLAHLYLLQHAYAKVEQFAAKSNLLVQADEGLRADNWGLIAEAREAQGDRLGARQARERARTLQ